LKRNGFKWGPWLSLSAIAFAACGVAVDVDPLQEDRVGDRSVCCAEEEKYCDGACRSKTNPEYGCSRGTRANPSCTPCALLNASAVCDSVGECSIAACLPGFESCNGLQNDGCEIDVNNNPQYCGGCNAVHCDESIANAASDCSRGRCTIRRCNNGFKDCNGDDEDGCEIQTRSDDNHCGDCTTDEEDFRCAEGERCFEFECVPE
jgi:hypothetical protein